jgi:hypothetical protein
MTRTLPLILALPLVVFAFVAASAGVAAFGADPLVRIVLPEDDVNESDDAFTVRLDAEDIESLGAFEFRLSYNPEILEYVSVNRGDFISSTEREVVCQDPEVEAAAVTLRCVSLGENPPGASGNGTLALIEFRPLKAGTSQLTLDDVQLLRPEGNPFPTDVVDGGIDIKSESNRRWLYIAIGAGSIALVAAAVAAIALRRRRSST